MEYKILFNSYYQKIEDYNKLYEERFNSEITQRLNYKINGEEAFLYLHPAHYEMIYKIQEIDKKIEKISIELPGIALNQFIKETLITEIKNTNDIEGVVSTKKEIKEILEQLSSKKHDRLYGMVNRYNFLIGKKDFNLITPKDVRNVYDDLVSEEIKQTDPQDILDGMMFRKSTVYLYKASGKLLHEGVNPESQIITDISMVLNLINNESWNDLIKVAMFHYLFGYIHPFYNGNGRVNRFISSYLLSKNYSQLMAFRLSQQIKEQKRLYYEAFEKTNDPRNKGDLGTFIYYFLQILVNLTESTYDLISHKLDQLLYYNKLLDKCMIPEKLRDLIFVLTQSSLFAEEGINIKELSDGLKQSIAWMRKKLNYLEGQDFITKNRQGHAWLYQANLKKLEEKNCNIEEEK